MLAATAVPTPSTPNILTASSIAGSSNKWNSSHRSEGLFGQQDNTLNSTTSVTTNMAVITSSSDLYLPLLHPAHQTSTNFNAHQHLPSLQASNRTNATLLHKSKGAYEQPKVYYQSGSTTPHNTYIFTQGLPRSTSSPEDGCIHCMWSYGQHVCDARMGTYNNFIKHLYLHISKSIQRKTEGNNCSCKCQWFACQAWDFNTPSALVNHVRQIHLKTFEESPKLLICLLPLSQPSSCLPLCQSSYIPQYFLTVHPVQKVTFPYYIQKYTGNTHFTRLG
ncbi:Hypothetical Protein CGB_I3700W [Cryptococcus gattii WM276]|uniref:Uncharacterized protein n=1 Tax=Cryptococcus gattii serotype B (strain WM276 / ATCC MYA-4071) TaxID=367775 RepID=E6RCE6_CRYGW|nr:Hypothetical Protein CGB_I3700W [Cryptococcus gattii WM276]ADV24434.1 Hypothetical Protein CGB_I3700W [Cryptococcus gattii WM276]